MVFQSGRLLDLDTKASTYCHKTDDVYIREDAYRDYVYRASTIFVCFDLSVHWVCSVSLSIYSIREGHPFLDGAYFLRSFYDRPLLCVSSCY